MHTKGVAIMKIQSISSKAITISVSMFPLWGIWAALSSAVLGRRNSLGAAWAQPGRSAVLSLCYYMLCRAVGKVAHLVAHKYTHFSAPTDGAIPTKYHNSTLCYTLSFFQYSTR